MPPQTIFALFFALITGLLTAPCARAETLDFPAQNFSIELPTGWKQVKPAPPGALLAASNPGATTRLFIVAKRMQPPNLGSFQEGLKKSMVSDGVTLQPDQEFKIADHPFVLIYGRHEARNLTLADYITATEGKIITIGFAINGALTTSDPDIDAIVGSFKFVAGTPGRRR